MAETTAHEGFECDPATQRAMLWNDNFIQLTNTNRKMFQFICCEMGPRVGKSEQMRAMRNMLKMKIGFYHRQKMQTKGRASRIVFALVRVCVCVVRACWRNQFSFIRLIAGISSEIHHHVFPNNHLHLFILYISVFVNRWRRRWRTWMNIEQSHERTV